MSPAALSTLFAGSTFGSALLLSGVYSPTVITHQLLFSDFYMLKVFMTASASSAVVMAIFKQAKLASCSPPKPSSLNLLHQYDGNIIGGLILGSGMALSGACPGTVLVQVGAGVSSALPTLGGALLGGMLWARFGSYATRKPPATDPAASPSTTQDGPDTEEFTVYKSAKISESQAILIFELACLAVVASAAYFVPGAQDSPRWNPVFGGLLIGASQAVSLAFAGDSLGAATAYEIVGRYINRITRLVPSNGTPLPAVDPAIFILGILVGSWGLSKSLGLKLLEETVHISPVRAAIGGAALIVGARMGGGCPSGHGISGMATLATSSFVTVASIFAGGIGLSLLLEYLV